MVSHVIAIDAMGGDRAPGIVLAGANLAARRHPEARFRLFGSSEKLERLLRSFPRLVRVSEVVPADTVIEPDMKPMQALRKGARSSMKLAIDDVRAGHACGVVSAGQHRVR